mgnify:CR=1 FL=1
MRDEEFGKLIKCQCSKNPRLQKSLLNTFSRGQRLHLCEAASKRNEHQVKPIFDGYKVDKPQIFDIRYRDKEAQRVVLRCPTSPSMYVHFRNLRMNKNIQVTFVRSQVPDREERTPAPSQNTGPYF